MRFSELERNNEERLRAYLRFRDLKLNPDDVEMLLMLFDDRSVLYRVLGEERVEVVDLVSGTTAGS